MDITTRKRAIIIALKE